MSETRQIIVAGIDGSAASERALQWAAKQAQYTGGDVHAVTAWQHPSSYGYYFDYSDDDAATDARKALEITVANALGEPPSVPVTPRVVKGRPERVLVEASQSADLLVVGSRGRGEFEGMLLGSVSRYCVQHASCPVLVCRASADG